MGTKFSALISYRLNGFRRKFSKVPGLYLTVVPYIGFPMPSRNNPSVGLPKTRGYRPKES